MEEGPRKFPETPGDCRGQVKEAQKEVAREIRKLKRAAGALEVAWRQKVATMAKGEKVDRDSMKWKRDPASAPEAFHRIEVALNNEAIREAIRNDEETHGACLGERGTHLRIK